LDIKGSGILIYDSINGSDTGLRFDTSQITNTTSATWWVRDITGFTVVSGEESVSAAGTVTARELGYCHLTGQTTSLGTTTLGNAVPAGMYRLSWYVKITVAGDAIGLDNLTVTVAWNDGGAQTKAQVPHNDTGNVTAFSVATLNKTYCGSQVLYSAASQNISISTTLVNTGATNPEYSIDATLEAI